MSMRKKARTNFGLCEALAGGAYVLPYGLYAISKVGIKAKKKVPSR
jgi:hypothetical protein